MWLNEPSRRIPVVAEAEVVVLGGGPSGIAAATAAARLGANTLLLERYGFLGGMGTAAMVTSFCGLHANVHGEITQVVHGLADDVLDRIRKLGGLGPVRSIWGKTAAQAYDNAAYKCAADDLTLGAGVSLRFHTLATEAVVDAGRISALLIETKSGRGAIRGQAFIDCSGDADLAAWVGAPYELGGHDGFLAYPTLMFRMGNVDGKLALEEGKPRLRELMKLAESRGEYQFPRWSAYINPQPHAGEWRANVTQVSRDGRPIDATRAEDFSYAEIEGRRQVLLYFDFLKRYVPGFSDAYLLEIAPQIGVRETRRIAGEYQLTGDDVLRCADFDDAIGVNGWPVEIHRLGDVEWRWAEGRGYYQIPFRALVPRNVDNLLVAGRCASATQDGQASLRVSGPCFAMGQAAGTASAMAVATGVASHAVDRRALQERLRYDGVFLGEHPSTSPASSDPR